MMGSTPMLAQRVIEQGLLDEVLDPQPPLPPPGYQLRRPIGRGGCGVVYLAQDLRLDRPVAIKFLSDASAADLERFRREARFTARLQNPSIVQIYELGELERQPYIAMQYIDGGNLADVELDVSEVVVVLREIALALHHAHGEGIVHRDIKAENILLDTARRAYLTDFGIARDLSGRLGETMSREGQVVGTPGLMPPEQARGELQSVDARSDVYALGATLFFKLTNRYPFAGRHLVEVLHAVIHESPPMLRSFNPQVPRAIEAICMKCMQKSREHRYQSMREVIEAFDEYLASGGSGGSSAWFQRMVGARTGASVTDDDDRGGDPYWTIGLDVVREIAAWDADLYRVSGSLQRSFTRLDAVRQRLDSLVAGRPDLAWARFYRGVVLFRQGRLRVALEEMERAIDRVRHLPGASFELGRLYLSLYLKEQHLARKHISCVGVEESLVTARDRLHQAVIAFQEGQRSAGDLSSWHRHYIDAVQRLAAGDFEGCVERCDHVLATDSDIEEAWKLRGDALRLAGRDPLESYDRALKVRRSYFEALYAKAEALLELGDIAAAQDSLQRACEIHPEFADARALLARTYLRLALEQDKAEDLSIARQLAKDAAALDEDSYEAAVILAEALIELGRRGLERQWFAPACEALRRAGEGDGCLSRVTLLKARATLEHARQQRLQGEDVHDVLENLRQKCYSSAAEVPDNEPWLELRSEVEREIAICAEGRPDDLPSMHETLQEPDR